MSDLTYSAEELEQLAEEEIEKGNFDAAQELADNAADTREAQGS